MSETKTKAKENSVNSLMPLWVYMILREKSSSEHPLSRKKIEEILKDKYSIAIGADDRKKTLRCIKTLSSFFEGKNIQDVIIESKIKETYENNTEKTVSAWHIDSTKTAEFDSYSVFSAAEANFIADMVKNSQVISSESTSALIRKLSNSLNESDKSVLIRKSYETGLSKNENKSLHEIKDIVEKAISGSRQLSVVYDVDGKEVDFAITPMKIDYADGKCYILAYKNNKLNVFFIDRIRYAFIYKEDSHYRYSEIKSVIEPHENAKYTKTIALDALFSNTRVICDAIKSNKYITFSSLSYVMVNNAVELKESEHKKLIPINTAYKEGKPYLIAIDPKNDYQPVFFRIDLIKDISPSGTVDFMETRRFVAKESHEYTDSHPFMLSGFTQIRATFLIKADSLDRVIDTFGNKAKFIYQKKAFETMGENARKLAYKYPELDFSERLGFDHNEDVVNFTVVTSDEEAVMFALQNGDCVELRSPENLRQRILDITARMTARHTRMIPKK